MKQLWLATLAVVLACEGAQIPDDGDQAIVAVDLEALAKPLAQEGLLPSLIEITVDGETRAQATLPAPTGLLAGHVALGVSAGEPLALVVHATWGDGAAASTQPFTVTALPDEVVLLPVLLERGAPAPLIVGAETRVRLPLGTRLAIEWLDRQTEQGPDAPAATIARLLRDPAVVSVAPFGEAPSPVDEVGALVTGERALAAVDTGTTAELTSRAGVSPAAAPRSAARPDLVASTERAATTNAPDSRITSWRLLRVTMGAPRATGDLIYYYSYCDCGRPAPDRAYTLTSPDGRTLKGMSDRHGFVLVPRAGEGRLDFGPTQRPRPRGYAYVAGDPATHEAMLQALGASDANTILTALLDLRTEPLPEAYHPLVGLLEHAELSVRLNAAVALSRYGDEALAPLVACRVARLSHGDAASHVETLGALRHPSAVPALLPLLDADDVAVRTAAAWALGFIGDPRALTPLEWALSDPDAAVRAEAALAVGRIGAFGTLEALEAMLDDGSAAVVPRVQEAMALATW
ncbi:MAG: hypothetical protein AMXMBFR64_34390 [Myxococcales bacterium]